MRDAELVADFAKTVQNHSTCNEERCCVTVISLEQVKATLDLAGRLAVARQLIARLASDATVADLQATARQALAWLANEAER
jgi:DNA-binding transcriptional regulator/RsmH inhibitor MraZ